MSNTEFSIEIEGQQIIPASVRIIKTMDTAEDNWGAKIPWTPGLDTGLDELLLPFKYPETKVFIDGKLQITGPCYGIAPDISDKSQTKTIEGASKTADIVDSTTKPPYSVKDKTLESRAKDLIEPSGIGLKVEALSGGPFKVMTIGATEKIFDHLLQYASQRAILISNTARGDLLFWKANTFGLPVAGIEEGSDFTFTTSATSYKANFDGRKLFNTYRLIRDTPGTSDALKATGLVSDVIKNAVSIDENVPKSRFTTVKANQTASGEIQDAADFARSIQYADALTQTLQIPGWKTPLGNVWDVNTLISVTSNTLMIPNGFTFLIRAVEFILDNGSQSVNLSIVPPQVYSGDPIPYIWGSV